MLFLMENSIMCTGTLGNGNNGQWNRDILLTSTSMRTTSLWRIMHLVEPAAVPSIINV